MRGRIWPTMTLVSLLSACVAERQTPTDDTQSVAVDSEAVVGGQVSAACGWPSTVELNGCTGTLIHPRIVTTAAHCVMSSSMKVNFTGGKGNSSGDFSVTGTCKTGTRGVFGGGGGGSDWGYCVLPEDPRIAAIPITPPLVGCEADKFLKVGASAWVVGFGITGSNKNDYGVKREVEVKINKIGNGTVDIGDKNVGACHGDSGGPIYMHLTDGTHDWGWRVFGSTSGAGGNCDCCTTTVYVDIRQHVKAIEMNEKIDVTPCTDADGKWAPTAACNAFQMDAQHGTGTYPMCTVALTKEPIASCDGALPPTAGGGAITAGRGGASAVGGASAAAGGGAGNVGFAGIGGAGPLAAGSGGISGALGIAGTISPPVGLAGRPAGVLPGTAAVGGATAMQPRPAGSVGSLTNSVQGAGAGAMNFTQTPAAPTPARSSGCQVAAMGTTASNTGWSLCLAAAGMFCSRQRRKAAKVTAGNRI